jgi:hypothetical protein
MLLMVLSWLSKLLASILVAVLVSTVVTTVLDQTVLSSTYLEGQLTSTNSYTHLSTALSKQVATDAGTVDPTLVSAIQGVLTPAVIKTKLDSTLEQLQAYYKGNGQPPVIDLTDIAAQAQAAGVPIGQDTDLTKPITLGSGDKAKGVGNTIKSVRTATLVASLVLIVLLGLLSWKRRKYSILPNVLISVGVFIGLLALALSLAPHLIDQYVKINAGSSSFTAIGHDLAASIAKDLGKRFGIIAAICLVIGIGVRIILTRLKPKPVPVTMPSAGRTLPR